MNLAYLLTKKWLPHLGRKAARQVNAMRRCRISSTARHSCGVRRYSGFPAKALIILLIACATPNDSDMEDLSRSPSPQVAVIMAR